MTGHRCQKGLDVSTCSLLTRCQSHPPSTRVCDANRCHVSGCSGTLRFFGKETRQTRDLNELSEQVPVAEEHQLLRRNRRFEGSSLKALVWRSGMQTWDRAPQTSDDFPPDSGWEKWILIKETWFLLVGKWKSRKLQWEQFSPRPGSP